MSGFSLYRVTQSLSSIVGCIYGKDWHFPCGTVVKNPPTSAGDVGSIPRSGRSPGEGNGNPLHYFCPGNPMGRGDWQAIVHALAKEWDTT